MQKENKENDLLTTMKLEHKTGIDKLYTRL